MHAPNGRTSTRRVRRYSAVLVGIFGAIVTTLSPIVSLRAQTTLGGLLVQAATGQNLGQLAKDLVDALNSAIGYSVKWFKSGVCAVNRERLSAIQTNMNLLAINKLNLANAADRYLVNDSTVTWGQFKTLINGVEHATQVTYDASLSSAQLFSDPSLGKPYRAFMVGLADRKQGLLPRMQMAAREVDQLTRTGGPVQGAKAKVKSEADALRAEATSLGEAADALGAFLGKISCQ